MRLEPVICNDFFFRHSDIPDLNCSYRSKKFSS